MAGAAAGGFALEAADVVGDGWADVGLEVESGKVMNLDPSLFLYLAPFPTGEGGGCWLAAVCWA